MAWYVFAVVDAVPHGSAGKGLRAPLTIRRVGAASIVVERRADVPPAEFGALRRHQAVLARIADRVPAILPVRFGTLLEDEELEQALGERDEEIAEAFAIVRDRVQFTWRRAGQGAQGQRAKGLGPGLRVAEPLSGREYLKRLARSKHPAPPAAFRAVRAKLGALVSLEKYQPAAATMPDSLYHLVDRDVAVRYQRAGDALTRSTPALTLSGPWPPFAFTPDLL
jgi:hypothetical protein